MRTVKPQVNFILHFVLLRSIKSKTSVQGHQHTPVLTHDQSIGDSKVVREHCCVLLLASTAS